MPFIDFTKIRRALRLLSFQYATVLGVLVATFSTLDRTAQDAVLHALHLDKSPAMAAAVSFLIYVYLRLKPQKTTAPGTDLSFSLKSVLEKPSVFFALVYTALAGAWDAMGADRQAAALAYVGLESTSFLYTLMAFALAAMRYNQNELPSDLPHAHPWDHTKQTDKIPFTTRNRDSGSS